MTRLPLLGILSIALAASTPTPCRAGDGGEGAISPEEIRADVVWLSAPERTGRGVGTPGIDQARDFIAERMRALGLAPAFGDVYFQPFEAPIRVILKGENALAVGGKVA